MRYLYQHKNSYYFRIRIPRDLQPILGKTEYKKALGKTNPHKAAILAQSFAIKLRESFEILRTEYAMKKGLGLITYKDALTGSELIIDHNDPEEERRTLEKAKSLLNDFQTKAPSSKTTIKLSQLMNDYCEEKVQEGSWKQRTESQSRAKLNDLLLFINDQSIDSVEHSHSRDYKSYLKGKDLSPKTINEYLNSASALMNWAIMQGYIEKNVFQGMSLKYDKKATQGKPFKEEQIQMLFNYPAKLIDPYQYWLPLLGIYTGARLEELSQLYLDDIKEIDKVWAIDINNEGDDKHLKTSASSRQVPIHTQLIELGFLEYVELLRTGKHERLFPELNKIKGRYSHYASRWFGGFTVKQGVREKKEREYVFHSLRHTVVNTLKQKGLPQEQISGLVGHDKGEGFTLGHYGQAYEPKVLAPLVESLDFDVSPYHFSKMKFTGDIIRKLRHNKQKAI